MDFEDTNVRQCSSSMHIFKGACRIYCTFLLRCSSLRHCREKERPPEMLHTCKGHAQSACTPMLNIQERNSRALAAGNYPSL